MKNPIQYFLILAAVPFMFQCTTAEYITPSTVTTIESRNIEYQYSDSTIARTFEMMPQLNAPLRIAVFGATDENLHVADDVESINNVGAVTYITPGLITLNSGFQLQADKWQRTYHTPRRIDLMHLRSLAAQSHSDLILFVETNHITKGSANRWAFSYGAILPMFFVPGNSVEVLSTVDFYLIDVRNGFIYTSYRKSIRSNKDHVKINFGKHSDQLIDVHKAKLVDSMLTELQRVINDEYYFAGRISEK